MSVPHRFVDITELGNKRSNLLRFRLACEPFWTQSHGTLPIPTFDQ